MESPERYNTVEYVVIRPFGITNPSGQYLVAKYDLWIAAIDTKSVLKGESQHSTAQSAQDECADKNGIPRSHLRDFK